MTERIAHDFYPTPEGLTRGMLGKMAPYLPRKSILECCDGSGAISDILKALPSTPTVQTNELYPQEGRSYDYQLDATDPASWELFDPMDWVITNPPFSLAEKILPLAFEHSSKGVIMLLRLSYLEPCERRADWLKKNTDSLQMLIPVNPRPQYRKDTRGTSSVTDAWFVFNKNFTWSGRGLYSPFQFLTEWKK